MSWESFIEKHVRESLIKQGFTVAVAQGGAFQAVDMYKRMSQASRKGRIFDDVLRHAKLWAEKQQLPADRFEKRKVKRNAQPGLF
ncbi:hypothetical protein GTGU_01491 [Trabulsiella guamensis ATCC 49490]|uniref:Uncharacterized protein n=1 Tax=Trabulsiella guamensis ATCC 49490 TaxID=1005994 RepID=A0A085ADJ9_9ENTR|nr:hypothetical protein [Trabulsiella guamensis]KFC08294.1 hypothetical protein GTGU_01491 [Trabulsiella guamensis ATCC 49490]